MRSLREHRSIGAEIVAAAATERRRRHQRSVRSRQPRVSNAPFPNVDVAALRTQAVLEGFIDFLRDAQSGKSLHAETLSRPAVELPSLVRGITRALRHTLHIPTRHGPQSWRQKRCRSARIIVYQVNNNRLGGPELPSTPSAKVSKGGQRDHDDDDDPEPGRHSDPFVRGVTTLRRAGRELQPARRRQHPRTTTFNRGRPAPQMRRRLSMTKTGPASRVLFA